MAVKWTCGSVARNYRSEEDFTCSGMPWEVLVHRNNSKWFWGESGELSGKVSWYISMMSPVKYYAIWRDQSFCTGLTTHRGEPWTQLGNRGESVIFAMTASRAFRYLANWARDVNKGEKTYFTDSLWPTR
jgi:hypothetical protein